MKLQIFWNLVSFEYKKILKKKSSMIVIILVTLLAMVSVIGTLIGEEAIWSGRSGSRYENMVMARDYARELSGEKIDADFLLAAAEAAKLDPEDEENYLDPKAEYHYESIYNMTCTVYSMNISNYSQLTKDQANQFYTLRRYEQNVYLDLTKLSESAKQFVRDHDLCIEEPYVFEYFGGYERYIVIMYSTMFTVLAAIAILFAPLFSGEYISGADSLILSSKNGKRLVILAKLFVMLSFSLGFGLLIAGISYLECMLVFGADGMNTVVQLFLPNIPWALNFGTATLFYTISMLGACILIGAMSSVLSAWFKTPFATVVIMAIVIIVPMFINVSEFDGLPYQLFVLFPSNMIAIWYNFSSIPYEFGSVCLTPYQFMPLVAVLLSSVFIFVAYHKFRRHEVR